MDDPAAHARALIDANLYLVLGTADKDGVPWAAPVYFAPRDYREFFWVSKPEARHSQNIVERPHVSIVIFDSSVPIGTGQGVYMSALASELAGDEQAAALEVYSRRAVEHGGVAFTPDDVREPAALRFYRATAVDQYVLDERDRRVPVPLPR
jgi:nitroimidazol reductase NimA-like FMN-containing flavoprotein (pyridoxamine 5'-phosphate oxidase superfamily)